MELGNYKHKELTVLHVDDDVIDTINIQRIFKKMEVRHRLVSVPNGIEALKTLRSDPQSKPHVILLDINMPGMSGLEFLDALRADPELKPITVFVLSTSDFPKDILTAHSHNVAGYLIKPTSTSKFNEIIELLLQLWAINEFPEI